MLDIFHLPDYKIKDQQIFFGEGVYPNLSNISNYNKTWVKPRGCSYVFILSIGAGGGGSGGATGAAGTARSGGGGGGAGGVVRTFLPAKLCPDILYVSVGIGGIGGASNTLGNVGTSTSVSVKPIIGTPVLEDAINYASGGSAGAIPIAGGGGSGGTVPVFALIGITTGTTGSSGTAGGAPTPTAVTALTSVITTGGAGGGGITTTTNVAGLRRR